MRSVLRCAALCLLLLSTFAAAEEPGELATTPLLQAIEAAAGLAPPAAIGTPQPIPKQPSSCPAWFQCTQYNCIITCNGSYCISDMTGVICDGQTTRCPGDGCDVPSGCADPCGYCECTQQGGSRCLRSYCYEF